jgi:hypothetical protein
MTELTYKDLQPFINLFSSKEYRDTVALLTNKDGIYDKLVSNTSFQRAGEKFGGKKPL